MKIIHTSDWHLGHRLYNYDRTDEEAHFFKQLGDIVAKEQPDALVVSGDIYHTGVPGNDVAREFTNRLLDVIATCPTMETIVIAGNHDSYSRLVVDEALWRRAHVCVLGVPAEDDGKADFEGNIIDLGEKGVIAAVPFCHPRNFPMVSEGTGEDRQKAYFAALANFVRAKAGTRPALLMAHLAVSGELDLRGHDISLIVGGEECVSAEELGKDYDYIALGHIHCPQWIRGGRKLARYCGTPRPLHFDEAAYAHGVDIVMVEHGQEPVVRTEVFTPLRELKTIGGDKGLGFDEALAALASSELKTTTYIRLNVRLAADASPGPDWDERARKACVARGFRFCRVNPIRESAAGEQDKTPQTLTTAELQELSDDEVLRILSLRHPLTDRQKGLLGELLRKQEEETDGQKEFV